MRKKRCAGFSLIELAIALIVAALLINELVTALAARHQRMQARDKLHEIVNALHGFVAVNGRLPCPATTPGNEEAITATNCAAVAGYVPGPTLGLLALDSGRLACRAATGPGYDRHRPMAISRSARSEQP